jgi:hypothetical protein
MSFDHNVYYHPEHYGLSVVGEVFDPNMGWEFDIFAVWKDSNDRYYWADDSGCSCPSPFENYNSLDELTSGTKRDALNDLKVWRGNDPGKKSDSEWLLQVLS